MHPRPPSELTFGPREIWGARRGWVEGAHESTVRACLTCAVPLVSGIAASLLSDPQQPASQPWQALFTIGRAL
jgi:hypothetical protein